MAKGIARAGFDIDLRDGVAREWAFGFIIRGARIEHKRDFKACETGNVFVEFAQKDRPSGIAVTTAQYWAFEFQENRWLIIHTDHLKRIARKAWRAGKRVKGGDRNRYDGVLVPVTDLLFVV